MHPALLCRRHDSPLCPVRHQLTLRSRPRTAIFRDAFGCGGCLRSSLAASLRPCVCHGLLGALSSCPCTKDSSTTGSACSKPPWERSHVVSGLSQGWEHHPSLSKKTDTSDEPRWRMQVETKVTVWIHVGLFVRAAEDPWASLLRGTLSGTRWTHAGFSARAGYNLLLDAHLPMGSRFLGRYHVVCPRSEVGMDLNHTRCRCW